MIKTPIQRLFHGKASIRSTIVNKALLFHEDLLIELLNTGEIMEIPYEEITKKGKWNREVFRSKHNKGEKYVLVDFDFKPTSKQETLI